MEGIVLSCIVAIAGVAFTWLLVLTLTQRSKIKGYKDKIAGLELNATALKKDGNRYYKDHYLLGRLTSSVDHLIKPLRTFYKEKERGLVHTPAKKKQIESLELDFYEKLHPSQDIWKGILNEKD